MTMVICFSPWQYFYVGSVICELKGNANLARAKSSMLVHVVTLTICSRPDTRVDVG